MAGIELTDLTVSYNGTRIIDGLNLSVPDGEILCLFGPSGCGKTTVLRTLLGALHSSRGNATIDGKRSGDYNLPLAYVPQGNELMEWLDVEENVVLWQEESLKKSRVLNGMEVDMALDVTGMTAAKRKLPSELSGGMARRTALARCLATHSAFMLLDEPFVSVERRLRRVLMNSVRDHIKDRSITAILVSHDYEEATFMADRVAFLTAVPSQISALVNVELPAQRNAELFDSPQFRSATVQLVQA